ncbi:hypothetical protein [Echinimonas agarilytica]|uniref:Uncharacterized protein n=1 Tax=Echinimonas agarilytica TaxID=1215918 RepID=A0AA41W824_9GAMM|nr:hypothetical protein [Echinimonas agarilytica]MCM2680207.1 hypothetical protein [Echinimonas agarilytica]
MKIIWITALAVIMSACSSMHTSPITGVNDNAKFGVLVLIDEAPTHVHTGTTAFQNFSQSKPTGTNYQRLVSDKVAQLLTTTGHETVALSAPPKLVSKRSDLFTYLSADIAFEDGVAQQLEQLAKENQLDYIITVYPKQSPAFRNSPDYVEGLGVFSYCNFGQCSMDVLTNLDARIYSSVTGMAMDAAAFTPYQRQVLEAVTLPEYPAQLEETVIESAAQQGVGVFIGQLSEMLQSAGMVSSV